MNTIDELLTDLDNCLTAKDDFGDLHSFSDLHIIVNQIEAELDFAEEPTV